MCVKCVMKFASTFKIYNIYCQIDKINKINQISVVTLLWWFKYNLFLCFSAVTWGCTEWIINLWTLDVIRCSTPLFGCTGWMPAPVWERENKDNCWCCCWLRGIQILNPSAFHLCCYLALYLSLYCHLLLALRRDKIKQNYLYLRNQGNYFQRDPSIISREEYRFKGL